MIKKLILFLGVPFLSFLILTQNSTAETHQTAPDSDQVTFTVAVPLSDLWRDTIAEKSEVDIDKKGLHEESSITSKIIGLDNQLMKNEKVKIQVYANGSLLTESTTKTDQNGEAVFKFTPEERGLYTIRFYDETYQEPFTLNQKPTLLYL